MNSAWDFVKRHKNKIAVAATLIGGVYATKKILDQQGYQPATLLKQFSSTGNADPMLQVRNLRITKFICLFLVSKEFYI
jgi:hypothetical protein